MEDTTGNSDKFRVVRAAEITDLNAFVAGLDAKEPTVVVAPDGARVFVLSEVAHARLMERFEDIEDSLSIYQAHEENEPVRSFADYAREHEHEHESKATHVPR